MMPRHRTDYIIVHCSAEPPNRKTRAADIDRWHRRRGWLGIGYHYVIPTDGTIETGRDEEASGAHVRGYNNRSIGICLIGGMSKDLSKPEINFTPEQMETLTGLLESLQSKYSNAEILGHHDLYRNKACPSFDVSHWLTTGELKP